MRLSDSVSFHSGSRQGLLLTAGQVVAVAFVTSLILTLPAPASQDSHEKPDLWAHTLKLGLEHSERAKAELVRLAELEKEVPVKRLASVILEEWGLSCGEQKLASARQVWAPAIDVLGKEVTSPLVIILGEVLPDGSFVPGEFKVRSGNERVDEICLGAAGASRFRPARSCAEYIRGPAAISFHFHL